MNYQGIKQIQEKIAFAVLRLFSFSIIVVLFFILGYIVINGFSVISFDFITKMPEDGMTKGGIMPAIIGTICLMVGSLVIAFPIGVFSGIYLNEYIKDGWFKRFINVMTNNLAGIPSIVFGLFGCNFL
jgi:phosphate transport system permease protein